MVFCSMPQQPPQKKSSVACSKGLLMIVFDVFLCVLDFSVPSFVPQLFIYCFCLIVTMTTTENSEPEKAVRNKETTSSTSDFLQWAVSEAIGEQLCLTDAQNKEILAE